MSKILIRLQAGLVLLFLLIGSVSFTPFEELPKQELPCLDKRFSVVVHVVKDSLGEAYVTEADIQSEMDGVNDLWSEICVSFEICEFNYIENFQWDTLDALGGYKWDQMLTAHHQAYRINIFYVTHIIDPPGVAGFADLGGINNTQGGGICIVKPGGALSHEMGHYWGLYHPFETDANGVELVDGSNCQTAGDLICDTPADPYEQFNPSSDYESDCIFNAMLQDPNGDWYDPDIGNIMSYYDCACHFTYDQYWRMANTYTNNLTPNGEHMW